MKAKEMVKKSAGKVKDAAQKSCTAIAGAAMKVLRRVLP